MADVSIDLLDYFNTWDVLVQIGDVDSFHIEATTRDLLDAGVSGDHNTNQKDLHTYDTTDTHIHDLDNSHQHWDDGLEERYPRRKSKSESDSTRKKLKQGVGPWSQKYTYIFLLVWNFIMLAMYSVNNFLYVPRNVWYIVVLFHVSAISLYVYDTAHYLLLGKGACKPSPIHIV